MAKKKKNKKTNKTKWRLGQIRELKNYKNIKVKHKPKTHWEHRQTHGTVMGKHNRQTNKEWGNNIGFNTNWTNEGMRYEWRDTGNRTVLTRLMWDGCGGASWEGAQEHSWTYTVYVEYITLQVKCCSYFKPNHNVFLNLTKRFTCQILTKLGAYSEDPEHLFAATLQKKYGSVKRMKWGMFRVSTFMITFWCADTCGHLDLR